jgi:hypothetical protein
VMALRRGEERVVYGRRKGGFLVKARALFI